MSDDSSSRGVLSEATISNGYHSTGVDLNGFTPDKEIAKLHEEDERIKVWLYHDSISSLNLTALNPTYQTKNKRSAKEV